MCWIFDKEALNIIDIGAVKCLPKALERNRHLLNCRMVYRELFQSCNPWSQESSYFLWHCIRARAWRKACVFPVKLSRKSVYREIVVIFSLVSKSAPCLKSFFTNDGYNIKEGYSFKHWRYRCIQLSCIWTEVFLPYLEASASITIMTSWDVHNGAYLSLSRLLTVEIFRRSG